MVRAGVVSHPREWVHSGFVEIQRHPKRYGIIDLRELSTLCGFTEVRQFQEAHRRWVEQALEAGRMLRDDRWSEAIAVGSLAYVENVKSELGSKALHREVEQIGGAYALRESSEAYNDDFDRETEPLRLENTVLWYVNAEAAET
jgi:hypothetical protein